MKKITVERIVLDPDEQRIRKTWGDDWPKIWKDKKVHGVANILIGTWSGYSASQARIVHTEYVRMEHANGMRLERIVFTDGTYLTVEIKRLCIEEIFKIPRMAQYDELVREARGSMESEYHVGQKREEAPQEVKTENVSEPQPEEKKEVATDGKNWWDRD